MKIYKYLLIATVAYLVLSCNKTTKKEYQIEAVNDTLIYDYPNPKPVNKKVYSYIVKSNNHSEIIPIDSKNLHTISVSIENISDELIESPYILGPQGYDFRSADKLAAQITEGATSEKEKFFRIHQWMSYHYDRFETQNSKLPGYDYDSYYGNTLYLLNQYGGSMCGDAVHVINGLLWRVPPTGSLYGRRVQLSGHQTGEAWFDGTWHNFDASPEIRWIYTDYDNKTIVPTWKKLLENDAALLKRIKPITGWDLEKYATGEKATGKQYYIVDAPEGTDWDYNYNLKPTEKFTMYYDMRGRVDQVSRNYSRSRYNTLNTREYRNPCDYGSAVFSYNPVFTNDIHKRYVVNQQNIKWTNKGLIVDDASKPASIIIASKSTWGIVGAQIKAKFINDGKVYFAVTKTVKDTKYSKDLKWVELAENQTFENKSTGIEGRLAYWVKFEFEGKGAGLISANINTEVQMNKYSIPVLKYGNNNINFTSANLNGGEVKITYEYDDKSKYDIYETATENYGTHIFYRVGGNHTQTWTKPLFYQNVKNNPDTLINVKVEIYQIIGDRFGEVIRTLKNEPMHIGTYWWYWNGRDDAGNKCKPGLYSYKVTGHVGESKFYVGNQYGERLILFENGAWPVPNKVK